MTVIGLPCRIEPDGYCTTHQIVNCKAGATQPKPSSATDQLTRIEARLNRIMRHLGLLEDE